MMNAGNLKGKTRQTSDWRRRLIAFVSALTLLISSCGLTAFAESDEDIYSDPVTAPIPAANTSPEPEEGEAEATPAPEGQPEEGTEPQEATGEGTETEGEPEVSEEPEDLTVYEPGTLTAEADGIGITVDYTAEARVPEGAVLTLTRAAGGDLYSALKSASKVLKTEENATWKRELGEDAVFYAITLTNPEGNEVHPETGVTLTCTNLEIPADATGFVTGDNAENLDWKDTLTVGFLPDAIGYAYLKQVQIGTVTLTHEDRDYMVTAAYGPDAGFPADTELKVREILPGTPEYALYSGMTDEALNEDWAEITLERYFDIAFVANGEELEPKADVDVQIVFRDKIEQNEETEVAAVHIENNEANVIEAGTDSTKSARHDNEAIDTVTFTSDSFSVYGVVQKKKITKKVLAADGKTYDINVSYGPEAEIPEGADLNVREILPEDENFESYLNDAMRAASDESEETLLQTEYARFFDIEIVADGQKVEPKSAVSVSISLTDEQAAEQSDLCVVHFDEEKGAVVLEAEAETASDIQFEAESFSVYGVITYPTAQPQGVADLGGRKFTIKKENYYIASTTRKIGGCERFNGTTNSSETPVWQFESTEKTGEYYISATIGGEKKYLSVRQHAINGTGTVGDAELSSEPKALVIQKTGNGYSISDGSYYLKFYNGHNNHDFIASQGPDSAELTLTFEDTPTVTKGEHYAIIVRSQDGGDCYTVKNDGTLERVIFYPETNSVKMDYPLFWEYTQTDGIHYNLRIPTLASGFNWQNLPSGYYYRYLDPNSDAGITEEENLGVPADKSDNENPEAAAAHQKYINNCAMRPYEDLRIKGYDYYLGIDENNMKVIGRASESEAAIVYFVKAENVLPSERQNHTVNHVDIAIEGGASLSVPLDYGDYFYYVDGVRHDLTVDVSNPITLTLKKDQIGITPDDMKLASITAFSTKTNKVMNDAFYITGYSQNHDTGKTAAQVRIEGSFKVADLEPYNKPENELTYDELQARLNNRVRYTVTVSKKELFQWEYEYEPGKKAQLYSAKTGEALSSNTTVNLSKSFDYWDEDNACPPIKDKLYGVDEEPAWREGHIIWDTSKHNGSGMDFELKATVNMTADTVAIHITKEILKTSGEILHPKTTVNNDFIVYQKKPVTAEDISAVTTVGMGAGSTAADYTGFAGKHTKRISISSTDDSGATTDYDVDRDSMVYIEESAESIPEYITDAEGAKWKYVRTYIETPYAWRQKGDEGKVHVAEGTKSVPEVLGAYGTYVDDNGETQQLFNRVQEFHVHNIYAKVETITAEKLWQDVSGYALNESEYIIDYPNITLQLYEEGGNDPVSVKELNKGNEWKCEWADLDADKSYYVKEATVLDTTKYESPIYIVNGTVADEGTALQYGTVQVVNRKKELKVKLRKCLKGNTKAPVEGAVFEIHHADRYPDNTPLLLKAEGAAEPATSFTSNAEGNFYIGYLPVGTYVIKETEAPSEYTLMDPVEFEILDEEHVDVIQATGVKRYLRYRTWGSTSDGDWQYKSIGDKGYFNLYCEDVPSKTITVTKEWFVNGTETSPSEGSITFDLYRTKQDFSTLETTETINQYTTKTVQLRSTTNSLTNPGNPTCYVGGTVKFRFHDAAGRNWNNTEYIYNGKFTRSDKTEYDSNSGIWSYTSPLSELYVEIPIENADSLTVDTYEQGFKVDFIESLPPEAESSGETAATTSALPGTRADLSAITEKELVGNYTISASSSPAWTYDSGNTLEKYDYSGATPVEWTYFAIERSVSGYTDTYEYDSDGNITIKNSRTYTPEGSLKITKVVTVNDAADISTITNGTYSFSVSGVAGTPTAGITHTVSVTFANGKATSYQIDSNEAVTVTGTDNTWSVVLTNLTPGDYTITETSSGPLALKSITGGKIGTVNLADKSVVATVTDEDYTPTTEAAQVVFTNNIRTVTVAKAWKDLNGDTASWPQDEEDNYTPEYVTVKLQRRTAGTSDEYADVAGIATQNIYPENLNDQPTTATFLIPEDEYEYRVVEVNVPAGFVADVAEIEGTGSYTITNRRVPTIDIEATKKWSGIIAEEQPSAIRLTLYSKVGDNTAAPVETDATRILLKHDGSTTDETTGDITWTGTASWTNLPKYDDSHQLIFYSVVETDVYFGTIPEDPATITGWLTPDMYVPTVGTEETEYAIINTPAMVEVPVEKTWDDFRDAGFGWSITLKLQYLLHYITGPENIADNLWHDYDTPPSIEHQITLTKAESDSSATINGTFGNLPKYCFENGSIYEYEYSAVETAYTVTKNGETLYSKSVDTFEGEKQYESVFDHNANSNQDGNYVIQLHNSVPTLNDSEPMTLTIEKTWEDASDLTGFSAEFVIKRYKQNAYRDLSGISNEDNTRKVRIVDGSNTIYENTYPVGSKYQIQVEFVTDHNNQSVIMNRQPDNTRIEINPNNPISAIYDVTDGDGNITINIQERGNLVRSIVATDELVGGIATKDSSYEDSFTLSNSSGWSTSVTVPKKITKMNETGTQENITIYSYYLAEVSSTPDNYSASFKTSDNVKVTYKDRIGSSATIIAENKKVPSVKVLKQWRGVIDTDHYPTITFSLYQELVGSNRAATIFVDEKGEEYSGIELSKEKNNWEWNCKVILPTTVDGYKARYYVKEDVTQGTDSSGRVWWLNDGYSRDNFAESGNAGEYRKVYLEEDPTTGVISGTFTIHNKMGDYVNMALKKKWVYPKPLNNGSDNFEWQTLTQEDIWANTVLGIQLIRRAYTLDYTPLTDDWEPYGSVVMVGYGPGGKNNAIHKNPNNEWFYLSPGDECWLWDIHNRDSNQPGRGNHDEGGLPAYGYYTKANGETVEVLYAYAFRETGVYSDLEGTPKDVSTWEYNSVSNWSWLTTGSIQKGYASDQGLLALLQKTENYLFPTLPPCAEWDRITNTLIPSISVTIEKEWVDQDGQEKTPDDSATAIIQIGLKSISGSESWNDITESTPLKFRIDGETTDQLVITKTPKRYSATLVDGKYDEYILTELEPEEEAEDWTLKLEGLNRFYTTGNVVLHQCRYIVNEVEDDGYELVAITGNPVPVNQTVTITNREKETFVDIEATKTWYQAGESENINNTLTNAQVTFTLQKKVGDGKWTNVDIAGNPAVMSVTDADAEAWKASWTDLPKYEGENLISYKVVESDPTVNGTVIALPDVLEVVVDSDDFQEVEDNNPKATVNIDNVLPKKNVEVTKIWTDGETTLSWPTDIASVQVGLTQKVGDGATSPVQKDSSQWIENITAENNQKVIFSDLPVYDNTGALITYGIEEISITPTGTDAVVQPVSNSQVTVAGDSWTVTISDADGTVTNTKVKTDIHILKVKENMETPLTGASFRLQKLGESGYADYGDPALKAVDGDGKATFNDLTDGTYQLNEEVVPAGYNSINGPITFTITNGEVVEPDAWKAEGSLVKYKPIDSADTIVIGNTPGVELPSTGGSGTLIYTLTGIFLITLAGTLLVARKRKANR